MFSSKKKEKKNLMDLRDSVLDNEEVLEELLCGS